MIVTFFVMIYHFPSSQPVGSIPMSILKNIVVSNVLRKVGEMFDKPAGYPTREKDSEKKTRESSPENAKGRSAASSAEKPGN